jgi:hypothetical protein
MKRTPLEIDITRRAVGALTQRSVSCSNDVALEREECRSPRSSIRPPRVQRNTNGLVQPTERPVLPASDVALSP